MNNKPVAWLIQTKTAHQFTFKEPTTIPIDAVVEPLYTHPVKELTDEEILDAWNDEWIVLGKDEKFIKFARAILRKAQEK